MWLHSGSWAASWFWFDLLSGIYERKHIISKIIPWYPSDSNFFCCWSWSRMGSSFRVPQNFCRGTGLVLRRCAAAGQEVVILAWKSMDFGMKIYGNHWPNKTWDWQVHLTDWMTGGFKQYCSGMALVALQAYRASGDVGRDIPRKRWEPKGSH